MKNTDFQPRIIRLQLYRPGDGAQAWKAMKIALQSLIGLGVFWLIASAIMSM